MVDSSQSEHSLIELAERVEKAEGPDRELDADIAEAVGHAPIGWMRVKGGWIHREGVGSKSAPKFTASLDAAMTLKHRGDLWCVGSMEDGPFARIVPAIEGGHYGPEITVHAETVESALTAGFLRAAALRARAAQEKSHV